MERTLVLIKPDALARALVGEVTTRFERKGLLLVGCNTAPNDPTVAVRAYAPYDNFYGRRGGTPTD